MRLLIFCVASNLAESILARLVLIRVLTASSIVASDTGFLRFAFRAIFFVRPKLVAILPAIPPTKPPPRAPSPIPFKVSAPIPLMSLSCIKPSPIPNIAPLVRPEAVPLPIFLAITFLGISENAGFASLTATCPPILPAPPKGIAALPISKAAPPYNLAILVLCSLSIFSRSLLLISLIC